MSEATVRDELAGEPVMGEPGDNIAGDYSMESYLAEIDQLAANDAGVETGQPVEAESVGVEVETEEGAGVIAVPDDGKPPQYRLRPRSEFGKEVFALLKSNPDLDEEQAINIVRSRSEKGKETVEVQPLLTPKQIDDRIRELRREEAAAIREYDAEKQSKIKLELLELEDQRPLVEDRYDRVATETAERLRGEYPEAFDVNSPLRKLMDRLDKANGANGSADYWDPAKAESLAEEAAEILGLAPVSQRKPASVKPAVSDRPDPMRMMAPGNRGAAQTPSRTLDDILSSVRSLDDYESMVARLG